MERLKKVYGPYPNGLRWRILKVDGAGRQTAVSFPTKEAATAALVAARNANGNWRYAAYRQARGLRRIRMVYFVHAASGPIKIGSTVDVATRLLELQVSHWEKLSVVGVCHLKEHEVHDRFGHLRIRGEWFRAEPELLDFIATLSPS